MIRAGHLRHASFPLLLTLVIAFVLPPGIAAAESSPILDRTAAALRRLGDDERGRWLLDGEGHAELALTGVIDGRIESVVLDRVRIDGDGTHWIVDYKTSTHEGGDLEGFLVAGFYFLPLTSFQVDSSH